MNSDTVRAIRVSTGQSQVAFARSIGVAGSTIAAVESYQRDVSDRLAHLIKQHYGADPDVLEAIRREREFDKMTL